jgi:aromatic ring-opening dioxygenase catalytic subunit (LigB family)
MDIVGAYACGHTGLMLTRKDRAPTEQADSVFEGFGAVRQRILDMNPNSILIIATDHMNAFPLTGGIPMFAIGVGPVARGMGDAGIPTCVVPVHQDHARVILNGCLQRGIDIAYSENVQIDHSFVTPLSLITPELTIPIVPLTVNCNVPPRPTLGRCYEVGQAIRESIYGAGPGRIVVVATGGLSHWVGDDERRAFMNRAPGSRIADIASFPVHLDDSDEVNESFDRAFLDTVCSGEIATFISEWPPERIEEEAGNGAQELRNWIMVAGVVDDAKGRVLSYEPVAQWLTGTAIIEFTLEAA